jgi:hypothetical protein
MRTQRKILSKKIQSFPAWKEYMLGIPSAISMNEKDSHSSNLL